jgi:hypothetical protein
MRSAAQRKQSRINGARSRGPVSAEARDRVRFNAVRTGCRAESLILPGEDHQRFLMELDDLVVVLQPRDGTEYRFVYKIARADWVLQRGERAQFELLKTRIDAAGELEELAVDAEIERLFLHPAGPIQLYGVTRPAFGEPPSSAAEMCDDPNRPLATLRRLEGSAKGCEALLGYWRAILSRVDSGLEIQAPDRLKAIRMLGLNPKSAFDDKRVALIFVASFALHPSEDNFPYDDLKSDMSTPEVAAFVHRVRRQWGPFLDAGDTAAARAAFLDLISQNITRLEAKLEVHLQYADERAASIKAQKAWDESPQGQQLSRYLFAAERSAQRARDAFWKHRREMENWIEDEGGMAEDGENTGEGAGVGDLSAESGVAEPAPNGPETNFTNEPEPAAGAPKGVAPEEVVSSTDWLSRVRADLRRMRDEHIGVLAKHVAGGGKIPAAVEQAILERGPLLPPIS